MLVPTDFLLSAPAWVQYRTRLELMHQHDTAPQVQSARWQMLQDPLVIALTAELSDWPGAVLNSHKCAGHALHKLVFLANLGFSCKDGLMQPVIDRILEHRSDQGPFQVLMNIPPHFGGSGEDEWAWALCDAPLLLYALVKFGLDQDERVQAGVDHLVTLLHVNGWPCAVSPELGKFRGPGKKDDPCPYATLIMLKLLAELPDWFDSPAAHAGTESLLLQWEQRQEQHPYMFYMGTDFCKLKAPLVWYDILHVTDVLTRFAWLHADARLQSMLEIIHGKSNREGLFTPESVWTAWKDWDFGQKKIPSPGLTYLCHRVLERSRMTKH